MASPHHPCLPRDERTPGHRRAAVELDREVWRFDHSWHGLTFPEPDSLLRSREVALLGQVLASPNLPEAANVMMGLGWRWILPSLGYGLHAWLNNVVARRLIEDDRTVPTGLGSRVRRRLGALNDRLTRWIWQRHAPDRTPRPSTERPPLRLEHYEDALVLVPPPLALRHWHEDWFFAWQRLAGTSPVALSWVAPGSVAQLQERFPVTQTHVARACPDDTLAAAEWEGRLFVVDYAILDGIEAGASWGWRKWLTAPIALFCLTPDRTALLPVAIQCGQRPGPDTPLFTPADGMAWQLAKTTFQVAESNYHGVVEHGTLCHMVMGAIAIALRRTLAPWHPVRVLLEPHLEMTVAIDLATKNLYEPGGRTPTLQSVSVQGAVELTRRAWQGFDWSARSGDEEFARRDVLSPDVLPVYPMRDDIAGYGPAIGRFVADYVALYYACDGDVRDDMELADFVTELRAPGGADLPTITGGQARLSTRAELSRMLGDMIWRAAPYHAVINYSVYDAMVYLPNMPTAAFAPPPVAGRAYALEDLLALLPPRETCAGAVTDGLQVGNLRLNRLGRYHRDHFRDPRVDPLVATLQHSLTEVGRRIEQANQDRPLPYTILEPTRVTASIHI